MSVSGELFMSFVLSRRAHARILSVDPSKALSLEGVHHYIDHRDIPGKNVLKLLTLDEEIFASKEVVSC